MHFSFSEESGGKKGRVVWRHLGVWIRLPNLQSANCLTVSPALIFPAGRRLVEKGLSWLLSSTARHRIERVILGIAVFSYLLHLLLILLAAQGVFQPASGLLLSPISAIYTPFSFILVYEIYLLIYYLPKSTSFYIGKQYEIITLIIIRRIFKDIGSLELLPNWFHNENDLQFTYDAVTSLVLFFLICLFYMQVLRRENPGFEAGEQAEVKASTFLFLKNTIALLLVPVMLALACFSLYSWAATAFLNYESGIMAAGDLNEVFFNEFFTILIIVDVLLLLASLFYSDQFQSIIRNSGFVISTILIKLSFSVDGVTNNLLITGSVVFGLLVLVIYNLFSRKVAPLFPAHIEPKHK